MRTNTAYDLPGGYITVQSHDLGISAQSRSFAFLRHFCC